MNEAPGFAVRRPLVVVTTVTGWHEPPRIRHQVTRQLLRFYNVLYVELPFHNEDHREGFEQIGDHFYLFRPRAAFRLLRKLRNHIGVCRSVHDAKIARSVERAISTLGYDKAALVNFQFDFPELMRSHRIRTKVYLCNDDFLSTGRPWQRRLSARAERDVISLADASLAVSTPLVERLKSANAKALLFLPGHEFEIPAAGATKRLRDREYPIRVCYMGFINSRLRSDWLRAASEDPDLHLTMIGPIEGSAEWTDLLTRVNVTHLGVLEGHALEEQLRRADVHIMPYDVRQEAVRAISAPNKLFQYLACGRPVIVSNLPSLLQLPQHFLYVASDAAGFVAAIKTAFSEDSARFEQERRTYAARNTWAERGESLREIIDNGGLP